MFTHLRHSVVGHVVAGDLRLCWCALQTPYISVIDLLIWSQFQGIMNVCIMQRSRTTAAQIRRRTADSSRGAAATYRRRSAALWSSRVPRATRLTVRTARCTQWPARRTTARTARGARWPALVSVCTCTVYLLYFYFFLSPTISVYSLRKTVCTLRNIILCLDLKFDWANWHCGDWEPNWQLQRHFAEFIFPRHIAITPTTFLPNAILHINVIYSY